VDSINKAFEIFEVFLRNDDELSINNVSKLSGINAGTVHRITTILVKRGYVIQPKRRGKYSLSPAKVVDFAKIVQQKLKIKTIAYPYLRELSQNVDEAVAMANLLGHAAFIVAMINLDHVISFKPESSTLSLYSTGLGKIFLANMSEKELQGYINSVVFKPRTPNTVTKVEELKKQIKQIRRDGIAYEDEEHDPGMRTVSAPVKDWEDNVVAAITVFGPTVRMTKQKMEEIAPVVKSYALKISHAIGYSKNSL
jgi:IclR family transcriptional regulator, KDG regulon repressor